MTSILEATTDEHAKEIHKKAHEAQMKKDRELRERLTGKTDEEQVEEEVKEEEQCVG